MSTGLFLAAGHAHTHNSTPYYIRRERALPITYARPRKFRATKKPAEREHSSQKFSTYARAEGPERAPKRNGVNLFI